MVIPCPCRAFDGEPEAKVVKARGCVSSPIEIAWLALCIGTLEALGLVFCNLQAVWASAVDGCDQERRISLGE